MAKKIAFDASKPVSSFDEKSFFAIIEQETEGLSKEDIKELWKRYTGKNFSLQLVINKASAVKRDMAKITEERDVVLLGSRDHIWTTITDGKKVFNDPFQSFVTAFNFKTNKFEQLTLDGKVTPKSRGIVWGKRCIIGCYTTSITKKGKTFSNTYISKIIKIVGDVNFTELLKDKYIIPEHLLKKWQTNYPLVVLYGEINKFDLEKIAIETSDANTLSPIPVYTHPISKTQAKTDEMIPTFQFSIKSPEEVKEGKSKVIKCRLMSQTHGRSVFDVKGWDHTSASDISRKEKAELSQDDFDGMLTDMNDYFGNNAIKVFVIGYFSKCEQSKKSQTFYYTINTTYVVQTDFKPAKPLTSKESEARLIGKASADGTTSENSDRERIIKKITDSVKVVGGVQKMTFENLNALGIFKEFSISEQRLKRIVEKVKSDLIEGKTTKVIPKKEEEVEEPKGEDEKGADEEPSDEPTEEKPTESTDEQPVVESDETPTEASDEENKDDDDSVVVEDDELTENEN